MSLTVEEKKALMTTLTVLRSVEDPVASMLGSKIVAGLLQQYMSPREFLEHIGEQIRTDHDHKTAGCDCMERHQFMLDVCTHLEKQKLNDEIISESLMVAAEAWEGFKEKFERVPTVTYVQSQYTIDTGVAGVFFIHPAAQK